MRVQQDSKIYLPSDLSLCQPRLCPTQLEVFPVHDVELLWHELQALREPTDATSAVEEPSNRDKTPEQDPKPTATPTSRDRDEERPPEDEEASGWDDPELDLVAPGEEDTPAAEPSGPEAQGVGVQEAVGPTEIPPPASPTASADSELLATGGTHLSVVDPGEGPAPEAMPRGAPEKGEAGAEQQSGGVEGIMQGEDAVERREVEVGEGVEFSSEEGEVAASTPQSQAEVSNLLCLHVLVKERRQGRSACSGAIG